MLGKVWLAVLGATIYAITRLPIGPWAMLVVIAAAVLTVGWIFQRLGA